MFCVTHRWLCFFNYTSACFDLLNVGVIRQTATFFFFLIWLYSKVLNLFKCFPEKKISSKPPNTSRHTKNVFNQNSWSWKLIFNILKYIYFVFYIYLTFKCNHCNYSCMAFGAVRSRIAFQSLDLMFPATLKSEE